MSALSQAEKRYIFCSQSGSYTDHGQPRWHSAGRLWDILYELTNVGDLQLPRTNPDPSNKRERDSDDPLSTEVSNTNTSQPVEGSRMIAGSRCVSSAKTTMQRQTVMQERPAQPRNELQLPIHTHDLGKLPLHPIVEYPAGVTPSLMGQQGPNTPIVPSMPTEGIRVNVDSANASLPSIYPLVYDDMITNFGGDLHGSAITSGSGGQTSGNLWGGWPGSFSLGPGELEPQSQQLSQPMVVMPGSEDTANPDTLVMWTNAPSGFEWVPF